MPAFDDLYEAAATFDEVYGGIVEALVAAAVEAAPDPIVYAVPGSPLVAERTVDLLRADGRVDVTARPGPLLPGPGLGGAGHRSPGRRGAPGRRRRRRPRGRREGGPFLVAQCWSRHLLSEVKLAVPDDDGLELPRPVLLHHLGLEDQVVAAVDWWELDRTLEPDHLTSVYIPALVAQRGRRAPAHEVTQLSPSWTRCASAVRGTRSRRTHRSCPTSSRRATRSSMRWRALLRPTRTTDAYAHLEEELGDLLFQIVFHARLADEAGEFDLADVARGVHDKLVHRHPHVFGDVDADTAEQVVTNWEAIKKSEKGRTQRDRGHPGRASRR